LLKESKEMVFTLLWLNCDCTCFHV